MVTLDELVDEVGVDATRFWMLMRSIDTTLDFDVDLAKQKNDQNPNIEVGRINLQLTGTKGQSLMEISQACLSWIRRDDWRRHRSVWRGVMLRSGLNSLSHVVLTGNRDLDTDGSH